MVDFKSILLGVLGSAAASSLGVLVLRVLGEFELNGISGGARFAGCGLLGLLGLLGLRCLRCLLGLPGGFSGNLS